MEKDNLEDSLNAFSDSVDKLLKEPTSENAQDTQLASMAAFGNIYSMIQLVGDLRPEIYEQFIIDSNDCLTGFTLVKEDGNRIVQYSQNVEFRKKLAIELKSGRLDYVSQLYSKEYGKIKRTA